MHWQKFYPVGSPDALPRCAVARGGGRTYPVRMNRQHLVGMVLGAGLAVVGLFAVQVVRERGQCQDALTAERETLAAFRKARAVDDPIGMMRAIGITDREMFTGDDGLMFRLAEARAKMPEAR